MSNSKTNATQIAPRPNWNIFLLNMAPYIYIHTPISLSQLTLPSQPSTPYTHRGKGSSKQWQIKKILLELQDWPRKGQQKQWFSTCNNPTRRELCWVRFKICLMWVSIRLRTRCLFLSLWDPNVSRLLRGRWKVLMMTHRCVVLMFLIYMIIFIKWRLVHFYLLFSINFGCCLNVLICCYL